MSNSEPISDQVKQGYVDAIRLLASSKKSAKEIDLRLKRKGYAEEHRLEVVKKLKDHRLLSDETLADDMVRWSSSGKKLGRRRISQDLKKRGISEVVIENAISQISNDDERENAWALAENKWVKLGDIDLQKKKQRIYSFLSYRGFQFDLCRDVVEQLIRESNEN